jgi:hypothetical protein
MPGMCPGASGASGAEACIGGSSGDGNCIGAWGLTCTGAWGLTTCCGGSGAGMWTGGWGTGTGTCTGAGCDGTLTGGCGDPG